MHGVVLLHIRTSLCHTHTLEHKDTCARARTRTLIPGQGIGGGADWSQIQRIDCKTHSCLLCRAPSAGKEIGCVSQSETATSWPRCSLPPLKTARPRSRRTRSPPGGGGGGRRHAAGQTGSRATESNRQTEEERWHQHTRTRTTLTQPRNNTSCPPYLG